MENDKKNGEEAKKTKKRLLLRRETLRKLNDRALAEVVGGAAGQPVGVPTDDLSDDIKKSQVR